MHHKLYGIEGFIRERIFPNQVDRSDCLNEKNIVEYQVYDYHFRSDDRSITLAISCEGDLKTTMIVDELTLAPMPVNFSHCHAVQCGGVVHWSGSFDSPGFV